MKILNLFMAVILLTVGHLCAQTAGPPVLMQRPVIVYPPIAKAAHVTGEVVVRFAIEDDGTTSSVQVLSGPVMLQDAIAGQIKNGPSRRLFQ